MAYTNSDHISCLKTGTSSGKYKHTPEIHRAEYLKPRTGSQKRRCVITYLPEQGSQDPPLEIRFSKSGWCLRMHILTSTPRTFLRSGKSGERWRGPIIFSNTWFSLQYSYL
ncbi:hypothetical protein D623_10028821 [Myotis brandtii]|uniref:Uncharacterized protein n=1 Tax=Myotis brandtii TaxID=109478 RepID=S7PYU6_MYOBR|nr:hypothetical protein D623_10028821 [Myotis brandtii]